MVRARIAIPLRINATPEIVTFEGLNDAQEHVALVFHGHDQAVPTVRIHSECLTGDVFGSIRCDCGAQLQEALERFKNTGGILLYMRQEGRSIGLYNKIDAYTLQADGIDTFEANRQLGFPGDGRDYRAAAAMLIALNVRKIELLSNNPDKQTQLERCGIVVTRRISTEVHRTPMNTAYLEAKARHGHSIVNAVDAHPPSYKD